MYISPQTFPLWMHSYRLASYSHGTPSSSSNALLFLPWKPQHYHRRKRWCWWRRRRWRRRRQRQPEKLNVNYFRIYLYWSDRNEENRTFTTVSQSVVVIVVGGGGLDRSFSALLGSPARRCLAFMTTFLLATLLKARKANDDGSNFLMFASKRSQSVASGWSRTRLLGKAQTALITYCFT